MVKLRYCDMPAINADATGLPSVHTYSANGMWDPDYTGGGHQPKGFDQWMAFYNHYTVVGSKINVEYMYINTTTNIPGYFGIHLGDTLAFPATLTNIQGFIEEKHVTPVKQYGLIEGASAVSNPKLSMKFSAKKFFSAKALVGEADYKGSPAANPAEQAAFHVVCWTSYSGDPPNAIFKVIIDYIAVLTEPNELPQS